MCRRFLVCSFCLLGLAAAVVIGKDAPGGMRTITFKADAADPLLDTQRFIFSPEIVADAGDGSLRLAHSVLVADEMGATDFHQGEALSDAVHVKKVFVLDQADVTKAELLFFGSAKQIRVNGVEIAKPERLPSTGWSQVAVPVKALRAGPNEVILSGPGSLLIEPGNRPGRSYKSTDGGKTWSNQTLGPKGTQQGEYLVRLRIGRHAPHGSVTSQVIDAWASTASPVGQPVQLRAIGRPALLANQPDGTRLTASVRAGTTPSPETKTWTDWLPLDQDQCVLPAGRLHRWVQFKFDLQTTKPQMTPRLPKDFKITYHVEPAPSADAGTVAVRTVAPTALVRGAVPFVYQAPSARLKLLREHYRLDEVIAPGKTEMEQLMLLRYWVRNQWHTAWGSHPAAWMPPWDALIILESKDQPDCLTMCTHYACVFYQCCLALGWNARHCILDHHCVAEVWVDQHQKWVMMDAGNSSQRADVGLHFTRGGVPLSARELHLAFKTGKTEGIDVQFTPAELTAKIAALCRPVPPAKKQPLERPDKITLSELPKYPVCQLENYRRYAFPGRNNFLSSLLPGELYQGWSEYFYDGYWWVGDTPDDPQVSPEYSWLLNPARPQDMDWQLNQTRIHLARTAKPDELQVDLESNTPNLLRLERQADAGGTWQATPASFIWKLKPGENRVRVRGVNHWQRIGPEAHAEVHWTPAP